LESDSEFIFNKVNFSLRGFSFATQSETPSGVEKRATSGAEAIAGKPNQPKHLYSSSTTVD
jgi:hypothetical protein